MAPHTPQRSSRPGEPGPRLDPPTPQRSEPPAKPGPRLDPTDQLFDASTTRHMLVWALAVRGVGIVALLYVMWLVWTRGYINRDQLAEQRPGDLLFFFIHGVHLVFHEAGHLIFMPFGEFMAVFGGSLNQVLIPAICVVTFYRQGRYASGAFTLFWVGQAIADVAIYAADGKDRILPLLGDSDPSMHDWGRILSWWGITERAESVGAFIFGLGMTVMIVSLLLQSLEILRLVQHPENAIALKLDD
jgi:hypothetical protein